MSEPERVEERYFPAISALLRPVSIPFAILFVGSLLRLANTRADAGAVLVHLLKCVLGMVVYVLLIRALCVVRLSPRGIRGSSRAVTPFDDITEVARHSNVFLSGFHVRSKDKHAIWIPRSVWTNPDFGKRVDQLASGSALNRAIVTERALERVAQAQDRGDS